MFSLYADSSLSLWEKYIIVTLSCETFTVRTLTGNLKDVFHLCAQPVELSVMDRGTRCRRVFGSGVTCVTLGLAQHTISTQA